jgi:hypothetical protein
VLTHVALTSMDQSSQGVHGDAATDARRDGTEIAPEPLIPGGPADVQRHIASRPNTRELSLSGVNTEGVTESSEVVEPAITGAKGLDHHQRRSSVKLCGKNERCGGAM